MSAVLEVAPAVEPVISSNGYVHPHLFTVAEYDAMIAQGIFDENDRVELLNGRILEGMPKGIRHAAINDLLHEQCREKVGTQAIIRNQNPIRLDDSSEPEPDLVLCLPPRETYFTRHPRPEDILLVAEISDTTLSYDRNEKARAYARAGLRQYLLLNLSNRTIEDYREPGPDGYQFKQTHRAGASFSLDAFPAIVLEVNALLPTE